MSTTYLTSSLGKHRYCRHNFNKQAKFFYLKKNIITVFYILFKETRSFYYIGSGKLY